MFWAYLHIPFYFLVFRLFFSYDANYISKKYKLSIKKKLAIVIDFFQNVTNN